MHHTTYILPNITGTFDFAPSAGPRSDGSTVGVFYNAAAVGYSPTFNQTAGYVVGFNASRSSAVYGASENVTHVNYAVQYFIKY